MSVTPFVLALLALLLWVFPARGGNSVVARIPTPVLNSFSLESLFGGADGRTLKTDACGQLRELEFIALPGTLFRVTGELRRAGFVVYRVETDDYPVPAGTTLYLDSRFTRAVGEGAPRRPAVMPDRERIVAFLKESVGAPYVWGGNLRQGVGELARFYYGGDLPAEELGRLTLAGLDCSGLLYAATNGATPRNTSQLVAFGRGLRVAGKDAGELAAMLKPLDLIVWSGHLIIVLDRETAIESRLECRAPGHGGVVTTPLRRRLEQVMATRRPLDGWPEGRDRRDGFVVRRWYGQ